jgi:hypothetical protein
MHVITIADPDVHGVCGVGCVKMLNWYLSIDDRLDPILFSSD